MTGVTPERILRLQGVHCALIALFTTLTFGTIRLTKIHMHTHHLNCNRILSVNVIYGMICILKQITAHLIVHSVAYNFKRYSYSKWFSWKLLQWFSTFSVRRSTCKIGDHIITVLNFKCQKNICNLCNLSPKIRPVDLYLKSIRQSTC